MGWISDYRRIWEKKYGKNAKHVIKGQELDKKKEEEKVQSETRNAYARRAGGASGAASGPVGSAAAVSTAIRVPPPGYASANTSAGRPAYSSAPTGTAGPTASSTNNTSAAALHPSWAAAKMRQKQLAEGPKATKIVFD